MVPFLPCSQLQINTNAFQEHNLIPSSTKHDLIYIDQNKFLDYRIQHAPHGQGDIKSSSKMTFYNHSEKVLSFLVLFHHFSKLPVNTSFQEKKLIHITKHNLVLCCINIFFHRKTFVGVFKNISLWCMSEYISDCMASKLVLNCGHNIAVVTIFVTIL